MKEVLAAVGVLALVAVGYVVYKNKFSKHSDCGCGCGGDCLDKTTVSIKVPQNQMEQYEEHNCNPIGLGDGWITNYDIMNDFKDMTVSRA